MPQRNLEKLELSAHNKKIHHPGTSKEFFRGLFFLSKMGYVSQQDIILIQVLTRNNNWPPQFGFRWEHIAMWYWGKFEWFLIPQTWFPLTVAKIRCYSPVVDSPNFDNRPHNNCHLSIHRTTIQHDNRHQPYRLRLDFR
ncbi:MAG: hypothetical protein FWH27_00645 [Planctomycetaceae bacterium]|nr:hypothetical protein [Planctomycetaceae bacterium]